MLKQKSLAGLLIASAIFAVATFVVPTPVQASCTWTDQALVDAHVRGDVFTDLAGPNKAGKGEMTVVNKSNPATGCTAVETLAVYRSTDSRPPLHQKFYDMTAVSVAPGETKTVRVSLPTCMYQIDAYANIVDRADQVNINVHPVLYGEVVGSNLCDAPVATPTPAPADCVLEGQKLVDAHVAGLVFTDLAGAAKAGQGKMTVRNDSNCEVHETLASYRSTNVKPPMNQKLNDITYLTIAPHTVANAQVAVPNCMYQIDAYTGFAPNGDQVNISQYQVLYGVVVGTTPCDAPAAPTPAPVTTVVNNITNTSTSTSSASTGEIHITTGNVTNSANGNKVVVAKAAPQVVYVQPKAPVAVPITAKTGTDMLELIAGLSTGSGMLLTLRRFIK